MPYEFPRDKVLPLPAPPVVKAQPLIDPDTLGKRSTNVACAIVYASILLHYVRAEALALATSIVSAATREHALVAAAALLLYLLVRPRCYPWPRGYFDFHDHPTNGRRRFMVVGATSGEGARLVKYLALKGHHLVAADASLETLKTVCDDEAWLEDNLTMVELDVRDAAAWEREVGAAAAAPGGLDALINVAAMPLALHAADDAAADAAAALGAVATSVALGTAAAPGGLDALINVAAMPLALHAADDAAADAAAALGAVATSVALGTAAAARRMASQPTGGHVLNVATLGALAPAAECALSHAAAAAARAYSVAAAKDLAPKGVRVTALITDAVRTPALEAHVWRDEVATGFVGGTISPEQFELAAARALLRRPVEMRCAASPFRALRVVVANARPGCLLVDSLIAYFDRRAGHAAQAEILRERVEDHEEKVQVTGRRCFHRLHLLHYHRHLHLTSSHHPLCSASTRRGSRPSSTRSSPSR
jgi:short-subunit dehydrogenase